MRKPIRRRIENLEQDSPMPTIEEMRRWSDMLGLSPGLPKGVTTDEAAAKLDEAVRAGDIWAFKRWIESRRAAE